MRREQRFDIGAGERISSKSQSSSAIWEQMSGSGQPGAQKIGALAGAIVRACSNAASGEPEHLRVSSRHRITFRAASGAGGKLRGHFVGAFIGIIRRSFFPAQPVFLLASRRRIASRRTGRCFTLKESGGRCIEKQPAGATNT
jgi:hypothetical protein